LLLAEEAGALAFEANTAEPKLVGEAALELLEQGSSNRARARRIDISSVVALIIRGL
jgi:hypothetical protein